MNRYGLTLLGMVVTAATAIAQQSYPMLMSLEPVALQQGTTSEHTVKSRYTMADAYEVLVSGSGVVGQVVLPEPKPDEKAPANLQALTLRFTAAEDAVVGVRDFRVATPNGISTTGQIVVVKDPVLVESGDNNAIESANEFTLPATVCGRIERAEDVDFFKFTADKGQTICFHVRCMRLQDRIHDLQQHADPLISLRNASGSTIAAADNVFAADPILCHTFQASGEYYLELRDVRYQGNQYWNYCIEANSRPYLETIYPLAVRRDHAQPVELLGFGLQSTLDADEVATGTLNLPEPFVSGIQPVLVTNGEQISQPVDVVLTEQAIALESTEPNDTLDSAQAVSLPGGVNGRVEREGDLDYFRFEAKKGERFSFDLVARRAGSPLDPYLRILDAKGNRQQESDDARIGKRTYADSQIENWVVPADGSYLIEIRDVHLRGGKSFVYFLDVQRSEPQFNLFTDTDKTPLTPGTSGIVFVRAERKNGFSGEIQLQVDGLPEGVTAECGKILPGAHQDGCIVLTAAADAKPVAQPVRFSGVATVDSGDAVQQVQSEAVVYQETYQPGGGRGHWPVEQHVVSIGKPGDVLQVKLSNHDVTLKRGQTATVDVELVRAEGFDKNVTLEVTYKHLNSVYGDSLPKGVTVDASQSKLLLTAGATKGKITLKAAADAELAEKQLVAVMANVSINFVMKATYASEPVFVTVTE